MNYRNMRRGWITVGNSTNSKTIVRFVCPRNKTDRIAFGQELLIDTGKASLRLNGKQIRSLRTVLNQAENMLLDAGA